MIMAQDNFSNLTLVFTVRIDSRERMANLQSALRYYSDRTDAAIYVLEADRTSRCKEWIEEEFPEIRYEFVHDNNDIFHRTHYINMQLCNAATTCAAVIDADVIIPINQLKESLDAVGSGKCVMALPYDGRFVNCSPFFSDKFHHTSSIESLTNVEGYRILMFGFVSVGGAFVVNIDAYRKCGWENEHFTGWGCEDFERVHRLEILGYPPMRVKGMIYHLAHPRGMNSYDAVDSVILATKREYSRICSMDRESLLSYVSTWAWAKNRPQEPVE